MNLMCLSVTYVYEPYVAPPPFTLAIRHYDTWDAYRRVVDEHQRLVKELQSCV